MEAKELRIGNYVMAKCQDSHSHYEQTRVEGIFNEEVHHEAVGLSSPNFQSEIINIKPIPLTEE